MPEDVARCRQVGMDGVLAKPLDRDRLVEVLGPLLPRRTTRGRRRGRASSVCCKGL